MSKFVYLKLMKFYFPSTLVDSLGTKKNTTSLEASYNVLITIFLLLCNHNCSPFSFLSSTPAYIPSKVAHWYGFAFPFTCQKFFNVTNFIFYFFCSLYTSSEPNNVI